MEEEIEERLQEELKDLTIEVKYFKIKMYNIYLFDKDKNRYNIYLYHWEDNYTFSANIEQIKYIIRKIMKGSVKNGRKRITSKHFKNRHNRVIYRRKTIKSTGGNNIL